MADWVYSQANRCMLCDGRAVIPTRGLADLFVAKSEDRLEPRLCPFGNGWHLVYPAVELSRAR